MTIRPGLVLASVGVAVAVVAGGCGSGSRAASVGGAGGADPAPSYSVFTDGADRFAVSVPSSWQRLDLTAPDVNATVARLLVHEPEIAAQVGSAQNLLQAGVRFLAVAPGGGDDANMVVRPAPLLAGGRIDSLLVSVSGSAAAAGGTVVSHPDVSIGGLPGLHVTVSIPVEGREVTTEQYYLVQAGRLYVLTVRAPGATVAAIEGSLRLTG